jgi:hypothetical protein
MPEVSQNASPEVSAQPFFCADCDALLEGRGVQQKDRRFICGRCAETLKQKTEAKRQGALFEEQRSLFNPATRENIEGFKVGGKFHPIRGSEGYNEFLAGDFDERPEKKFRRESKEREQYKEEEKFYREQEAEELRKSRTKTKHARAQRSLAQFVRGMGGIVSGGMYAGEIRRLGFRETGTTGLLNQKARQGRAKQTAEYVMDAANEEGFRDRAGLPFSEIGAFLLAVEDSAVKGIDSQRRRGPTRAERDRRALAKAYAQNPISIPPGIKVLATENRGRMV